MKALSLWQPWASLWCSDAKVHETRHWPTSFRGLLLVHAAKRVEKDFGYEDPLEVILRRTFGAAWRTTLPTGALVGVVKVIDCKRTEEADATLDDECCGDFTPGRFAFQRGPYWRFEKPIPWRGAQGFFEVPDSALISCGWSRELAGA
jgi:hypothetical protein